MKSPVAQCEEHIDHNDKPGQHIRDGQGWKDRSVSTRPICLTANVLAAGSGVCNLLEAGTLSVIAIGAIRVFVEVHDAFAALVRDLQCTFEAEATTL